MRPTIVHSYREYLQQHGPVASHHSTEVRSINLSCSSRLPPAVASLESRDEEKQKST
jgi:hypothetical protein